MRHRARRLGRDAKARLRDGLLLSGVTWGAACGEPAPDAGPETDSLSPDTATVSAQPPDSPPFPSLPGEGEPRLYRLRLVNGLAADAVVFASAGAARVALDTVPAQDSVHVDLRLRADRVELEAEDAAGRRIATDTLELGGSGVNRWVIVDRE